MLQIDQNGEVINDRVKRNRITNLEHGDMPVVKGIIVHQTGGSRAASTLASYRIARADGAHFLIDKDGSIMQTASVKKTNAPRRQASGSVRTRVSMHPG